MVRRQARARQHRPRGARGHVLLGGGPERLRQVDAVSHPGRARAADVAARSISKAGRSSSPASTAASSTSATRCSRTCPCSTTSRWRERCAFRSLSAGAGARDSRRRRCRSSSASSSPSTRTSIRTSCPAACSSAWPSRRRCSHGRGSLLMDEPFGALDPETRESMQVFLLELWEETSMTIFFVTHDMEEAVYLGTRVLVLSQYYLDDRGAGVQARIAHRRRLRAAERRDLDQGQDESRNSSSWWPRSASVRASIPRVPAPRQRIQPEAPGLVSARATAEELAPVNPGRARPRRC